MNMTHSRNLWLGLSYDDVLVIPAYSEILPSQVSPKTQLTKKLALDIPFLWAAMDTVTEVDMGIALGAAWWIWIIHKNMPWEQQAQMVKLVKEAWYLAWAAIWVGEKWINQTKLLVEAWVDVVVLDSAHGHSFGILSTLKELKDTFPELQVIAWNIATWKAALALVEAWADAVKVGIWPGSICTTRVVAWVGRPQFSAVLDVADTLKGTWVPVIADWWIKHSGDVVKALVAWANSVMLWSVLAGTDESPWEIFTDESWSKYKIHRWMWSLEAMQKWSADRYSQEVSKKMVPEGIVWKKVYKWPVEDILFQYVWWLRSWMGYCWAATVKHMWEQEYTQISSAGYRESHPHSISLHHNAPNYWG